MFPDFRNFDRKGNHGAANWNDHRMHRSLSAGGGRKKLPISLGFKCAYGGGECGSRAGIDSHRRHRNSSGTPCADPMNSKSMSLTQRGDSYTGNLRLHDTLGVCTCVHVVYHTMYRLCFVILPHALSHTKIHVIMCIR